MLWEAGREKRLTLSRRRKAAFLEVSSSLIASITKSACPRTCRDGAAAAAQNRRLQAFDAAAQAERQAAECMAGCTKREGWKVMCEGLVVLHLHV